MNDKNIRLVTAESVRAGHPDKFCDQVADAILDAHLRQDPNAHVAVEVFAAAGKMLIGGEVTSKAEVDCCKIVTDAINRVGYTMGDLCEDPYDQMELEIRIHDQSPDISAAVGADDLGAGDQRAGVVGDIDLEKADVAADPDRSADGGERFGLHRRAQIVDRAVQRDVVLAVVDARERARGGVSHRVEKAAVHAAPDVGIFRRDVGGQHALFLVDRNDADAVVTDKATVLARKHFLIIFDHDALASFRHGISD